MAVLVSGLCLGGVLAWGIFRPRPSPPLPPPSPVQLTASAGLDIFPSFSPDGANLVYSSNRSGGFELYVRSLAPGGREVQLTDDGQENFQPAWSPEGTLIAYHSKKRGGIWVLPSLGGNARQVSPFGSRPAWSPDGKLLAFESGPLVDLSASYLGTLPPSVIWISKVDGSDARAITAVGRPAGGHGSPSFSPDGTRIAFSTYERALKGELWTVDVRTKEIARVATGTGFRLDPVFSADGGEIYFGGVSEGWNYGVFRVPVSKKTGAGEGEAREVFNFGLGPIRQLAVSPDGKRLAYSSLTMASNLISQRVVPRSGEPAGPPENVTRETGRNSRPAFSPDGKRLALTKWKLGSRQDIWICDEDGGNPVQRTTHAADDDFAQWFPNGERLAFVSHRLGYTAFFTQDLATSQEALAADVGRGVDFLRLAPDGLRFSFHRAPEGGVINTWIGEFGKGEPRQITFDHEMAGFACWSPDGKLLALEVKRGEDVQVGIVSSGGGAIRLLTSEPGQAWPYTFSPDGSRVAFAGLRGGLWNIFWIPVSGGSAVQVTKNSRLNAYLRYPAWSPRGDRIIYEHAETYGNVWVLENFR